MMYVMVCLLLIFIQCIDAKYSEYRDYKFYISDGARVNFSAASDFCSLSSGDLASIHSEEELNAITDLLNKQYEYYIGLYGPKTHWVDGSKVSWSKWYDGQPIDRTACVALHNPSNHPKYRRRGWLFKEVNCYSSKEYICKIRDNNDANTIVPPKTQSPTSSSTKQSDGGVSTKPPTKSTKTTSYSRRPTTYSVDNNNDRSSTTTAARLPHTGTPSSPPEEEDKEEDEESGNAVLKFSFYIIWSLVGVFAVVDIVLCVIYKKRCARKTRCE